MGNELKKNSKPKGAGKGDPESKELGGGRRFIGRGFASKTPGIKGR